MSPVYSPHGLKIRLEPKHAFGLMSRLGSPTAPAEVLSTTEALEGIPGLVTFILALACFASWPVASIAAVAGIAGPVIGTSITMAGLYVIPGLVTLARHFTRISAFIQWAVLLIVSGSLVGWLGAAAFVSGRVVGFVLQQVLELWNAKRIASAIGQPLTLSEINFFNAFRLHADAEGVAQDLELTAAEELSTDWAVVFEQYMAANPQLLQLFVRS